jgi:hypothetical protein
MEVFPLQLESRLPITVLANGFVWLQVLKGLMSFTSA